MGLTSLKEALQQIKQSPLHKHKLEEAALVYAWKAVMPRIISKRTERVFYKQEKIFVQLNSAPLRQELQLSKDKVLALLRDHAQGCTLVDVVFL